MGLPLKRGAVLLLLLLSGCGVGGGKKTLSAMSLPYRPPDALLAILAARNDFTESLTGRLSSKVATAGGSKSSTQLILLKKPSLLRLDVLTPFGTPALSLATDGSDVTLHYHSKKRFFSGNLKNGRLSTLFASSLDMKDLALILGGGVPLISHEQGTATVTMEGDFYRLNLENGHAREEIFLEPDGLTPARGIIYGAGGGVVLSLEMGDFREAGGIRFPMKIDLNLPVENYEMKVRYSSVALNGYTGIDAFRLAAPEGMAVESVESLTF